MFFLYLVLNKEMPIGKIFTIQWEIITHLVNKGLLSLKSEEYEYTPISVLYTLCVSLVLESKIRPYIYQIV